jgi:hypothetical protein
VTRDPSAEDNYLRPGSDLAGFIKRYVKPLAEKSGRPQRVHDHAFGEPCRSATCATPISTNGHHPKSDHGERSEAVA